MFERLLLSISSALLKELQKPMSADDGCAHLGNEKQMNNQQSVKMTIAMLIEFQ